MCNNILHKLYYIALQEGYAQMQLAFVFFYNLVFSQKKESRRNSLNCLQKEQKVFYNAFPHHTRTQMRKLPHRPPKKKDLARTHTHTQA